MWVYVPNDNGRLFTVGFFEPGGVFHSDEDFDTREKARARCHVLNGGAYLKVTNLYLLKIADELGRITSELERAENWKRGNR